MGKTIQIASDRAHDHTKTVLPAELARGVYIRNIPSLQALKLMHLMVATAGGKMADPVRHEIRLADVRGIKGMKNHTRESLTPLFEELRGVVIRQGDPLDDDQEVFIGGLIDYAVLSRKDSVSGDTVMSWFFGRMFMEMAAKSDHWAILDRQTVFHLSSKYALLLFQYVASLASLKWVCEKTFTLPELRALMGVPEGKIKRFADLNKDVLGVAVDEINQLSRLDLTVTTNKIGRTVTSVTISWKIKPDPTFVRRELAGHSAGRKARRDGTVEETVDVPVRPFPETGGLAYSSYWLEVKRAAGCNKDNELIASDFRRFCSERAISLRARNIEKIFSDYCRAVGKV